MKSIIPHSIKAHGTEEDQHSQQPAEDNSSGKDRFAVN